MNGIGLVWNGKQDGESFKNVSFIIEMKIRMKSRILKKSLIKREKNKKGRGGGGVCKREFQIVYFKIVQSENRSQSQVINGCGHFYSRMEKKLKSDSYKPNKNYRHQ